ncbi:MAG: hypothetical protein KBS81_04675 [Spirochaetales bacterium]|nr:hypothetical protein [Candidatus Physcosoma equi]
MKNHKLDQITYIQLPESVNADFGTFKIDSSKKLPVLRQDGKKSLSAADYTVGNIVAGMITVIAYDEENPEFKYYKDFVLAVEPGIVERLNTAAIAKEQQKDYEFAKELFLAVYHLLPQPASCINLATLYSYLAVESRKKEEGSEKEYIDSARATLMDGLSRFGENDQVLAELASFEAFMGNTEEANDFVTRYLMVAEESEKKEEMKKLKEELSFQLENENAIQEAYDYICLEEPDKALPIIDKFVKANPRIWNGHFLKGWALRIRKDYKEAKECFMECLKLGESNAEIYNELAICELEDGNKELAKAYLETACDLDEDNLNTVTNLAFLYVSDGQYDEAREYVERARYLAKEDRFVKALIDAYEKATGEKIGEMIHEDYVTNTEDLENADYPAKAFENEFRAFVEENEIEDDEEEEEHHCCGHHHHEEGEHHCCGHHHEEEGEHHCCGHHHEEEEHHCCGGHHHEEGHQCCGHHHHEEEHHCCGHHHHDEDEGCCCGHHH